jgi:alanine racemase
MDMCFADISRSKKNFKEGDAVELFGENLSVELWAKAAKTISYEIFCQITKRVKRIEVKDK